ncbi:MAG: hypothetical protein Q9209_006586 [Squamulea sp. 1 TL-2023]
MEQKKALDGFRAQPATRGSATNASASFVSRIGASVSGLVEEALLRPNPKSLISELSSTEAEKSGSSSNSTGPSAMSMLLHGSTTTHPSSSREGSLSANHGFRSQPTVGKNQAAIDDFDCFLSLQEQNHSDPNQPRDRLELVPFLQHADSDASLLEKDIMIPPALVGLPSQGIQDQLPNGNPADGAAVVAMLSDPAFCTDDVTDFTAESGLTSDVKLYGGRVLQKLAQKPSLNNAHTRNPLSLIPDFRRSSEADLVGNGYHDLMLSETHKVQTKSGVAKSGLNEDFEVQPWIEILTTYNDEVWGDTAIPLVQAAREEANAIRNGDADCREDYPAIRRLAMVAGHMWPKASG